MGVWAKSTFSVENFSEIGIVVAGTSRKSFEEEVLNLFDEIICEKDALYHSYIAKKNGKKYPIVFNVYGAAAMVDLLSVLHDGGCNTVIFVGSAYGGFKNLEVGSIVLTDKSYHFDGIYHPIEPDRKAAFPDKKLKQLLERTLKKNGIEYSNGINISVPAVTFQLAHANKAYQKIKPTTLEMELAACLSRAKDIGIRSAGILIVSDNKKSSLGDETKRKLRHNSKLTALKIIINNINQFRLPELKSRKKFTIDKYLAGIIEDPDDSTNIYKDNHKKLVKKIKKAKK